MPHPDHRCGMQYRVDRQTARNCAPDPV